MVWRQISIPNILKGIHPSMATRLVKPIGATNVSEGAVPMTGGLALDTGLLAALKECLTERGLEVEAKSHADSITAGAIGAAICAAFRYDKLAGLGQLPTCPPYDFGRRGRISGFAQAGGVLGASM